MQGHGKVFFQEISQHVCVMVGWIEWSGKLLAQEGEAILAGVQSLLGEGEGSGAFPSRHLPHEGAGAVGNTL